MFLLKWCKNFVPYAEYNDAYLEIAKEWNAEIQKNENEVDWNKMQELCKRLTRLFGYVEWRTVKTVAKKDLKNLWFLH